MNLIFTNDIPSIFLSPMGAILYVIKMIGQQLNRI
jgi:hypothetical protein